VSWGREPRTKRKRPREPCGSSEGVVIQAADVVADLDRFSKAKFNGILDPLPPLPLLTKEGIGKQAGMTHSIRGRA